MTTTKSYSKNAKFGPAYRAALKTQFPFAIISGILFLILFLVVFIVVLTSTINGYGPDKAGDYFRYYFKQGIYGDIAISPLALVILAVTAMASTLVGMSYLHKKNTVDVYHALPVTRPQLLSANLLATLTAVLGPFVAMYMLTMIVQLVSCAGYNCFNAEYFRFIFFDVIAAIIYTAAVAAFVAFVSVNVGTLFDAFAVTMAIGFSPPLVYLISGALWQTLVYGALFEPTENSLFLSPFMFIFKIYAYMNKYQYLPETIAQGRNYGPTALVLLFGLVLAAALFVAAAVCYRRRKSEIAEQTQPRGVLQIIVKLIAAFLGGSLMFAIFSDSGFAMQIIAMLLGAVGIGLIAEIILSRGVRWISKSLKWLLGAGVVYCLILVGIRADAFGYASRVPELDSIASVQINYRGRFTETDQHPLDRADGLRPVLTDPESINIVREAHTMAINNKPPKNYDDENFDYDSIRVEYRLKNGLTVRRTYNPVYHEAYGKLAELVSQDDYIRANSTLFWAEENPELAKVGTVELYASIDGRSGRHANVLDDTKPLFDAIRADMLDQSREDITNPQGPAMGFIRVNFRQVEMPSYRNSYYYGEPYATITVTREYKRTLEVLRQLKLDGDFSEEPLRLDEVVKVGLVPTWEGDYYGSNRVRSFNPWTTDDQRSPWYLQNDSGKRDDYPYSIFYISTDAADIKAVAEASKDILFTRGKQEWHRNYAIVYFEMADGSSVVKALRLDDLPPGIREEARDKFPEVYGSVENNTTVAVETGAVATTFDVVA